MKPGESNSTHLNSNISVALDYLLLNVIGDERPYLKVTVYSKLLGLLDSGTS